jgi:hypothetical protein
MLQSFINQNGNKVVRTVAKVISMGSISENINGTKYRFATVEVDLPGLKQTYTAKIWETNMTKLVNKALERGEKDVKAETVMLGKEFVINIESSSAGRYVELTPFAAVSRVKEEDFNMLFDSASPKLVENVSRPTDETDIF